MPKVINDFCILCGKCQIVCPVNCILEDEPFYIDFNKCIDCNKCLLVCPVEAIIEK